MGCAWGYSPLLPDCGQGEMGFIRGWATRFCAGCHDAAGQGTLDAGFGGSRAAAGDFGTGTGVQLGDIRWGVARTQEGGVGRQNESIVNDVSQMMVSGNTGNPAGVLRRGFLCLGWAQQDLNL